MVGMAKPDPETMQRIAAHCVTLVAEEFGHQLDWSLGSLTELDLTCASLLEDGPLSGQRLDLWWQLIGAYTGEVVIRAYGGQWVENEKKPEEPAISALGITGFPFVTTYRVLSGEEGKSLASFGRALPVIAEHSRRSRLAAGAPHPTRASRCRQARRSSAAPAGCMGSLVVKRSMLSSRNGTPAATVLAGPPVTMRPSSLADTRPAKVASNRPASKTATDSMSAASVSGSAPRPSQYNRSVPARRALPSPVYSGQRS